MCSSASECGVCTWKKLLTAMEFSGRGREGGFGVKDSQSGAYSRSRAETGSVWYLGTMGDPADVDMCDRYWWGAAGSLPSCPKGVRWCFIQIETILERGRVGLTLDQCYSKHVDWSLPTGAWQHWEWVSGISTATWHCLHCQLYRFVWTGERFAWVLWNPHVQKCAYVMQAVNELIL